MRLLRSTFLAPSVACVALLVMSCLSQDPAVVDPLDPPEVDSLVITPQDAATAVDAPVAFVVADTTIHGHTVNGVVEWTASGGTIDTSGVFVAAAADTYEVHARRAGLDGHSIVVVSASPETPVPPSPPVTLAAIEVTPGALRVPPRGTQQFSAIGRLSNGNTATVRVNWTASGGSITTGGLYTAGSTAGTFRVIAVRQGDTQADTSAVTVTATPPTFVGVQVSPVSITVAPGVAQQFSAVGKNSDGTNSSIAVTWSATGGTITTGGLYTAGATAGTFRVIAVRQGDTKADTASVTITAPAPTLTAVEVTPASASLAAGATRQFTARGAVERREYDQRAGDLVGDGRNDHGGRVVHRRQHGGNIPGDRGAAGRHPGGYRECHDHGFSDHAADAHRGGSDAADGVGGGGGDAAVHGRGAVERRKYDQRAGDLVGDGRNDHGGRVVHRRQHGGNIPGDRGAAGRHPGGYRECHDHGFSDRAGATDAVLRGADAGDGDGGGGGDAAVHGARAR